MILQATVATNSSADPENKGRVRITAPNIWGEPNDSSDYYPVINNTPLNVGDVVLVWVESMTSISNALVLGKRRDNNHKSNGSNPKGFNVLWESVSDDGKKWGVCYTVGDELWYENNDGVVFGSSGGNIQIHTGNNGGLVNIEKLNSFIQAVASDLAAVGSGANVSNWLANDAPDLEDSTVLH